MAASNKDVFRVLSVLVLLVAQSFASGRHSGTFNKGSRAWSIGDTKWSVQVEEVESGDVHLDPVFRVAIYEHLLTELERTTYFKDVWRSGDRLADSEGDLLILKVKVNKFDAGSETKRAVTTVAGATKITAEFGLETRRGQTVKKGVVNADVRWFGENMKVTRSLARNIASKIKNSKLPEPDVTRTSARVH